MTADLRYPMIHLNGSSREHLLASYRLARTFIGDAIETMRENCTPHMRDYYLLPDGGDAFREAMHEHNLRVHNLEQVKHEIETLMIYVASHDQNGARS